MEQLSLLDLLAPELEPTPAPAPEPAERVSPWQLCEACGESEIYSWIHPTDSAKYGHPVCTGMNLTLNHIAYSMGQASTAQERDPYPCCHDKNGIHGKKISKPTREHWLDHVRVDIDRAKAKWKLHPLSFLAAVGELRAKRGITPDEAPVVTEPPTV